MKLFNQLSKLNKKKQASQFLTLLTLKERQSNTFKQVFNLIINILNMEWETMDVMAKIVQTLG